MKEKAGKEEVLKIVYQESGKEAVFYSESLGKATGNALFQLWKMRLIRRYKVNGQFRYYPNWLTVSRLCTLYGMLDKTGIVKQYECSESAREGGYSVTLPPFVPSFQGIVRA